MIAGPEPPALARVEDFVEPLFEQHLDFFLGSSLLDIRKVVPHETSCRSIERVSFSYDPSVFLLFLIRCFKELQNRGMFPEHRLSVEVLDEVPTKVTAAGLFYLKEYELMSVAYDHDSVPT